MKKTINQTAGVCLVLGLAGFGGWTAGRAGVRGGGSGISRSAGAVMDKPAGGVAAVAGTGAHAAGAAEGRREALRTMLVQARDELRAGDLLAGARARAEARVAEIRPEDMAAALDVVAGMPGGWDRERELVGLLLAQWSRTDGPGACEFALSKLKMPPMGLSPVREPLTAWAGRDPQAAFGWFMARLKQPGPGAEPVPEREGWMPVSNMRWIFGPWARQDAAGALAAFQTLTEKAQQDGAITGMAERAADTAQPELVLAAVAQAQKQDQWYEVSRFMGDWLVKNPDLAPKMAAWLDGQKVKESSSDMTGKDVLKTWMKQDEKAATEWWLNRPTAYPGRESRLGSMMEYWSEADPFAAAEWLAKQPLGDTEAAAMARLAEGVSKVDPERAFAWAGSIPNEFHRGSALETTLKRWAEKDAAAAREALGKATFTEAERTRLEKVLTTK